MRELISEFFLKNFGYEEDALTDELFMKLKDKSYDLGFSDGFAEGYKEGFDSQQRT